MLLYTLIPIVIYFVILFGILFLIYKWVTRFIALKEEHNNLLKQIIDKMPDK